MHFFPIVLRYAFHQDNGDEEMPLVASNNEQSHVKAEETNFNEPTTSNQLNHSTITLSSGDRSLNSDLLDDSCMIIPDNDIDIYEPKLEQDLADDADVIDNNLDDLLFPTIASVRTLYHPISDLLGDVPVEPIDEIL